MIRMNAITQNLSPASSKSTNMKVKAAEIKVTNISKSYGAGLFAKEVIKDCSFTIERNKLTVLIGPSGCGKSTLIRLLAGFEKPSSGNIEIDGKRITGPGRERLVVFQETALLPRMTTYDNIMNLSLIHITE